MSNPSGPRTLVVLPDWPVPAATGLHLRMLSTIRAAAEVSSWETALYFSTADAAHGEALDATDEVFFGGQREEYAGLSTLERLQHRAPAVLRSLIGRRSRTYPFSIAYDAISAEAVVASAAVAARADFVVLPAAFMHYCHRLVVDGFKVIIDAADVQSDLAQQMLDAYPGRSLLRRLSLRGNVVACRAQERLHLAACCEVWCTSADEAARFNEMCPTTPVVVVPNAVPAPRDLSPRSPQEQVVGFIGTYSYTPNLVAAHFLVNEVISRVRAQCPSATLQLAGRGLAAEVAQRFQQVAGVRILNGVPDAARFIDGCDVLALPVTLRGGVPLKLVDSLARARPVVAAPELIDGTGLVPGRDVLVAEPAEFVDSIVRLLQDTALAETIGANGHLAFLDRFSTEAAINAVVDRSILARWAAA